MDLGIEGRTAFVAGASSGLGYAVAFALAREGCRVAICSRDEGRIAAAAARLVREAGVDRESILPLVCDVTDERAVHDAVDRTGGYFGGLHILVTNAGGPPPGYIDDLSLETWRADSRSVSFQCGSRRCTRLCKDSFGGIGPSGYYGQYHFAGVYAHGTFDGAGDTPCLDVRGLCRRYRGRMGRRQCTAAHCRAGGICVGRGFSRKQASRVRNRCRVSCGRRMVQARIVT